MTKNTPTPTEKSKTTGQHKIRSHNDCGPTKDDQLEFNNWCGLKGLRISKRLLTQILVNYGYHVTLSQYLCHARSHWLCAFIITRKVCFS